jgi:hypothetical protein
MSTVPPERFAAEFARLRPGGRAALLADLWRARGRTVDRDGRELVLDGGTRVTFETIPDRVDETVDVVVAPDPQAGVHAAAETAGASVRDAADVRELLLYGLDRGDAEAVYRRHFGRSLYYADTELPADGTILGRLQSSRLAVATAAAALLVLVAVPLAVGTGGLATDGASEPEAGTGSASATPTEGTNGESTPPGVDANGTVDVNELAAAHAGWLRTTPFVMRVRYDGPENGSSYERAAVVETTLHVENNSAFRFEERTVGGTGSGETTTELYADGERQYVRIEDERGVRYNSGAVGGASNVPLYVGESRWNLLRFLATTDASVERLPRRGGVLIRATGSPWRLGANVSDYSATAVVRPDGVVESLSVEYRDEDAGTAVEFVQTVESVGTATVPEPDWYADHPDR